ncbi:hypothetical protein AALP_AA6G066800 [Arabis alpina]|uniref:Leucine-rich repeat-containing N-terminal plant-type domain-containing protein n=1 Tax=Arabis alpina TaxID=50452 RepID=A0A087GMI9_ARAAL|nr:hypothetical protein AALP_AA6G066800 [Arabis alpina]
MTSLIGGSRQPFCFLLVLLLCCVSASSLFHAKDPVDGLATCHPSHIQALAQFKSEFDSSSCNQTDYFNGVWCDNTTGVVTKLRLRACLSGTLRPNSSLFSFRHLRYLYLSHNDFTSSSLPSGFGSLNKLEVLSLSFNGFKGQVPSSFSNLSLLSFLDLSQNELTGSFPPIHNLTKLSVLSLSYNHFFGSIPSSLFTMPFLSFLDLRENQLTDSIEVLTSSSSRLQHLLLGHNQFERQILKPISKLITLTNLDLSFLNISYPIDLTVFSSLKSLTYFDLSGNIVSPTSLSSISGIPLSMEELILSGCNIPEFPNMFKTLHNLTFLDLTRNQIKGKLPAWLWSLPFLTTVSLFNNSLSGFEGRAEVLVNSSVQVLSLDSNNFEGALPHLPLSINTFSVERNNFSGNIPLSICNRNSLVVLDLAYNNFTGPIPQCLSNLTTLSLRKNNLEGSLPDVFYAGSSMRLLDVGYNQLTGKLPKSLVNCSSLEFLSVDHNGIEDTFPFWLKDLPGLKVLILRSNKCYGSISPPHQGPLAFPELRIFEISDNNFTGSLSPSYFVNWKTFSDKRNEDGSIYMIYKGKEIREAYAIYAHIDLRYKGLSMEQENVLTFYAAIDFSGNRIEGQIPESIGLLKELIALNLSNNAFTGHIPLSFTNLQELESLDLSRNELSGTIPNGLKTLTFLAYVNVSHNQLKGEIPQGTQITGQPKSSFEGNVGLCGLPLVESCFGTNVPPTQQPEEEEKDNEVLSWKAVVIGYGLGVLLGLVIAQVIASYKPEWLVKIIGPNKPKYR